MKHGPNVSETLSTRWWSRPRKKQGLRSPECSNVVAQELHGREMHHRSRAKAPAALLPTDRQRLVGHLECGEPNPPRSKHPPPSPIPVTRESKRIPTERGPFLLQPHPAEGCRSGCHRRSVHRVVPPSPKPRCTTHRGAATASVASVAGPRRTSFVHRCTER